MLFGQIWCDLTFILSFTDLSDVSLAKTTLYVLENEKTEVLCKKPAGAPEPTITWLREDGQALPKRFSVDGCCTLQNNRSRLNDSGNYTCTAKNKARTSSKTIQIVVSSKFNIYLVVFQEKTNTVVAVDLHMKQKIIFISISYSRPC